jgi:hypothetical protein
MKHEKDKIAQYKKQYDGVYKYVAEDGKSCLLRSPDLKIIDACRTTSGGSSIKFDKAMVENCWLEGDLELKTVDKYQIGLFDWLPGIVKRVDGKLEEL